MEALNLNQVRVSCRSLIKTLWNAENDRDNPRPLQYGELLKESKMCSSTFNRWLDVLCEGKIVRKFKIGDSYYYCLGKWGENILDLDANNDFWGASVIFQIAYEKEVRR
jgi:hypothetical protein